MRLRAFRDPTLRGAMEQVRASLGEEALILATRRVSGGVEVTAALDVQDEPAPARSPPRPATRPIAPVAADGEQARLAQLDWHGVPMALARRLRAGPLTYALSLALRFAPLELTPEAGAILLVGPPGAGKTLTAARLATRLVLSGARPLVICADGARAGAGEQLAAFTRLLGLTLVEAGDLRGAVAAARSAGQTACAIIDSAGCDPFCVGEGAAFAAVADAVRGRLVAVLPGGLDPAEAEDLAAAYAGMGAALMVATRLDAARRLGGVLSAAAAGLALAELGVGPGAADGLVPATADLLARRLLTPIPARPDMPPRRKERPA